MVRMPECFYFQLIPIYRLPVDLHVSAAECELGAVLLEQHAAVFQNSAEHAGMLLPERIRQSQRFADQKIRFHPFADNEPGAI